MPLSRSLVSLVPFVLASGLAVAPPAGAAALTADQATATAELQDLAFSPDGGQLALTLFGPPEAERTPRRIWLYTAASGALRAFTHSAKSERMPRFSPDGRQLAFLSDREGDDQIYLMPIDGGEARRLTRGVGAVSQLKWSPDGRSLAFLAQRARTAEEEAREKSRDDARVYEQDDRYPQAYTVDVASGEIRLRLAAPWRANDLVWAPQGGRFYVAATADESAPLLRYSVLTLDAAGGEPTPLARIDGPIGQLGISPDGAWLSYLGCRERGPSKHDLFLIPASGGPPRNLSAPQVDHTLESYGWRPDGRLVAAAMFGFRSRLLELGVDGAAKTLLAPEMAFEAIAVSPRGPVALASGTAIRPPELYLAEPAGELRRLSDFHAAFAGYQLSSPTFITYPSFDGMPIEAMVLAPPGVTQPRRLPTVVIPHGGPAWRFADGFQPLAQMLATTGHLVLMPNVRGSQGRSYEFMTLARNDWGGADYRDLMAGVDQLVAEGQADPQRLAIAGWSYGGYMAAWAITQTGRFKAAVAGAGLFDLISEFGTEIQPSYDEWYFGLPWENPQIFLERSPLTHVAKAKTPTLLLHGAEDLIDPLSQSLELYRALKHYGVPTELVIYPREGHTLRERAHISDRYQRSLDWLRKYLGTAASGDEAAATRR